MQTENLRLVVQTPDDVRAMIDSLSPADRADVSPAWLDRALAETSANPWLHGFKLVHRSSDAVVGTAGFKGPPAADGIVEIAYQVSPDHQGMGYATEAAEALTAFALSTGQVRVVRAHTFRESNASTRVLTKCGFQRVGEVTDPEDGPLWRWERTSSTD